MIYFTSDTHFQHTNIIKYCNRPFKDVTNFKPVSLEEINNIKSNY